MTQGQSNSVTTSPRCARSLRIRGLIHEECLLLACPSAGQQLSYDALSREVVCHWWSSTARLTGHICCDMYTVIKGRCFERGSSARLYCHGRHIAMAKKRSHYQIRYPKQGCLLQRMQLCARQRTSARRTPTMCTEPLVKMRRCVKAGPEGRRCQSILYTAAMSCVW